MNRKMRVSIFAALVLAACGVLFFSSVELGALAQNANSSTTPEDTMNANAETTTPRRRRRAPRRAAATAEVQDSETQGGEQADLSGTYTGRLTITGGHDMSGQATLTITGNQFTLEGEGMNHSGRVYAVTTRGYTGASFFFSDIQDSTTNTPLVASVRARKTGDRLSLTPVPGARTRMTFTSGRR